jgi:pyridoxamine 5'-phosphate oxidase
VGGKPLDESSADADPLRQLAAWFEEAHAAGIELPEAAALATASANGAPSLRMVLLKGFGRDGFVFYSNHASRKGRELEENPRAALLLYWYALGRQVRVEGPVERLGHAESETYFATRPLASRLSAWASRQSEPVASRAELEAAVEDARRRFGAEDVPLPDDWGGYRLRPERIELWQHREDRLHDRLLYVAERDDGWTRSRLQP